MKFACLGILALLFAGGGEHERGLKLLDDGKFGEAAAAFRKAIEEEGVTAELSYNLALALWRAGEPDEAEIHAEKAATLSDGEYSALRDGLLGNLRYDTANSLPEDQLEQALAMARQARAHYLRGATREDAPVELARNLERAQRLIDELEKKLEEQEKEENDDEEKKDEEEKKDDEENEDDEEKKSEEKKSDEEEKKDGEEEGEEQDKKDQKDQSQDGEPQESDEGEPEGEPDPNEDPSESGEGDESEEQGEPEEEPQPGEEGDEGEESEDKPAPAPGEQGEEMELSPEEKKRLMDLLDQLDEKRQELRARQKARRPKVEKDW